MMGSPSESDRRVSSKCSTATAPYFIAGRWDEGPDVLKRGWEDENLDFDEALRNLGY